VDSLQGEGGRQVVAVVVLARAQRHQDGLRAVFESVKASFLFAKIFRVIFETV
jgi:hypothetical protein